MTTSHTPDRLYGTRWATWRCACGKIKVENGMLLPLVKFQKDKDGWPLDKDGNRMKRAPIRGVG